MSKMELLQGLETRAEFASKVADAYHTTGDKYFSHMSVDFIAKTVTFWPADSGSEGALTAMVNFEDTSDDELLQFVQSVTQGGFGAPDLLAGYHALFARRITVLKGTGKLLTQPGHSY